MKQTIIRALLIIIGFFSYATVCGQAPTKPFEEVFEELAIAEQNGQFDKIRQICLNYSDDHRAQYFIGMSYIYQSNPAKAVEWMKKSGEQGFVEAQYTLGLMYMNGDGVSTDDFEALKWYTKAAELGHIGAMVNIGYIYVQGGPNSASNAWSPNDSKYLEARKKLKVEALKWLKIAYDNGDPNAGYFLEMILQEQ